MTLYRWVGGNHGRHRINAIIRMTPQPASKPVILMKEDTLCLSTDEFAAANLQRGYALQAHDTLIFDYLIELHVNPVMNRNYDVISSRDYPQQHGITVATPIYGVENAQLGTRNPGNFH